MTAQAAHQIFDPTNDFEIEPYRPVQKVPIQRSAPSSITPGQLAVLNRLQPLFDARFPPIRSQDQDILIISWAEIERQFLDLCAPWDQQNPYFSIQRARINAAFESPEKTLRTLFVLNSIRTNLDTPEPRWGTGESYPMP